MKPTNQTSYLKLLGYYIIAFVLWVAAIVVIIYAAQSAVDLFTK